MARRSFATEPCVRARFMFCVAQSGTGQTFDCSAPGESPSAPRAARFQVLLLVHHSLPVAREFQETRESHILPKAAAELAPKRFIVFWAFP